MKLLKTLPDYAKKALGAVEGIITDTGHKMETVVAGVAKGYDQLADKFERRLTDVAAQPDAAYKQVAKRVDRVGQAVEKGIQRLASGGEKEIDELAAGAKDLIAEAAPQAGPGADALKRWGGRQVDKLARDAKGAINSLRALTVGKISVARAAIAKGFQVARSRVVGAIENTANVLKTVYVNLGCWGEGHSDFALVWGKYVVVCSWISDGVHRCQLKTGDNPQDKEVVGKIMTFLEGAKGKGNAKPAIRMYDVALTPLTADNATPLVLLGDLHIHLFTESPFDTFTLGLASQKKSLMPDFKKFLEHAKAHTGGKKAIIQAGDCFEVWGAQILMDVLCDLFVVVAGAAPTWLVNKLKPILEVAAKHSPNIWKPLFEHLPEGRKGEAALRRDYLERASPRAVAEIILSKNYADAMPRKSCLDQPLDFTDAGAVESAIKERYDNAWDDFTRVRGNHDNTLPNQYLRKKYNQTQGTDGKPRAWVGGKKDCIIVEHGETLDDFNKPSAYDQPNHGFEVARVGCIREWDAAESSQFGALLWDNDASREPPAKSGDDASWIGRVLQQFCRSRAFDLRIHGAPGEGRCRYRLIALGHSHIPEITPDRILDEAGALGGEGLARAVAPWAGEKTAQVLEGLPI